MSWGQALSLVFECTPPGVCVCYFPITVIEHHNQGNLQKKGFILTYSSRERVHNSWMCTEANSRPGDKSRKLKVRTLNCECKAERANQRQAGIFHLKSAPRVAFFHQQGCTTQTPQTAPPTGDQRLKGPRLWRTFPI